MIRLDTVLAGLGGALGGGFCGATAHYAIRTLRQRHRDEESGLQAQRQAVHQQFVQVCAARDWVAGLSQVISASDFPGHRQQLQDEAMLRQTACHATWEMAQADIDSDEVRSATARLDLEVATVLGQVAKGDFAPDLNPLAQRLDELTAAAKHRLSASPRSSRPRR
ncbi:hypothetical protein GCM10010260_57400 [Streptomyces filipinensis]|uniref:Uncharacterized protein n=1 Tax=Streptomyces filipinensis TaxID=66887 RepID=A0A918MCW2_9ACTN|nr:hypothetical protein [Streptomyces filipinensis]GGV11268.1 hypothetical protein GCM10010260_57400 [Streptomyces filipinensis]